MNPIWLNAVRASGNDAWYRAGGAPQPVAAYQPKGAASLAASYTNLANPGTFDAGLGVEPTWASGTGWTFNGTTQYLTTGVTPTDFSHTILVRVSAVNPSMYAIGAVNSAVTRIIGLAPAFTSWLGTGRLYANGNYVLVSPTVLLSGVMCIAGLQPYLNGVTHGAPIPTITFDNMNALFVGVRNDNGTPTHYFSGNIQAVAIYSSTLTASQVAAVSAAVAAL